MQFNGLDIIRNIQLKANNDTSGESQRKAALHDDEEDGDNISGISTSDTAVAGTTQSPHPAVLYAAQTKDSTTQENSLDQPTSAEADGWHIGEIHANEVWPDYTGEGIVTSVIDTGFPSFDHPDLDDNIRTDLADFSAEGKTDSKGDLIQHGTNTSGLVGAEANGSQVAGVAYDTDIAPREVKNSADTGIDVSTSFADVMNNSWGFVSTFNDAGLSDAADAVSNGRGGLGSVVVFSAGNDREDDISSNIFGLQSSSDTITVAATNTSGGEASFSSFGSSVLVTAPGTFLNTTDGVSETTDFFAGTSGSAPIVSGVSALVLEANPDIGYRDVQKILALSAQYNDQGDSSWTFNGAEHWNGGGMHFSPDHGFGMVDARAAVQLAETWQGQRTAGNEVTISAGKTPGTTIPDNGSAITSTLDMSGKQNVQIETVDITVDVDNHGQVGDLVLILTSPDGTHATLLDTLMDGDAQKYDKDTQDYTGDDVAKLDYTFGAQNFRGETSAGEWTLAVQDVAGGNQGLLSDWSLVINGESVDNNDTYFFSDDFGTLSGRDTDFNDTNGGTDTINAAMTTSGITVDLGAGTGEIDGQSITTSSIENVTAGAGQDTLTGDTGVNHLQGGRNDDTIHASAGDDTLDGGRGSDQIIYDLDVANFLVSIIDSVKLTVEHISGELGIDTLLNFETLTFDGDNFTKSQLTEQPGIVPMDVVLFTSDGNFRKTTDEIGTNTYSMNDMGTGDSTSDALTIDRSDARDMTVTVDDAQLPGRLRLDGEASNDTITLNGTHDGLDALIRGWDGDDTISVDNINGQFTLLGHAGDDILRGNSGSDRLKGGTGADTLYGEGGDDKLKGGAGGDELNGGAGKDRLFGGADQDVLNGGAAHDELHGGAGNDILNGDGGVDNLFGDAGDDTFNGGTSFDRLHGGAGNDILYGDGGDDKLKGGAGDDELNGGAGEDRLFGGADQDVLNGGAAHDELYGLGGADTLYGDGGVDNLFGDAGDDTLNGGAAFDRLHGGAGNDTLDGGDGSDNIKGGEGIDTLVFNNATSGVNVKLYKAFVKNDGLGNTDDARGIENVTGTVFSDEISGSSRDNVLDGGGGVDNLFGRGGDDTLNGGTSFDRLHGGAGNDILNGDGGGDKLKGGAGDDKLNGGAGKDRLFGDADQDVLNGGASFDRLYGGAGNDILRGDGGGDQLNGGDGEDTLYSDSGADTLRGNAGADIFAWTNGTETSGIDRVGDFDTGEGDILDISDILIGFDEATSDIENFLNFQAPATDGDVDMAVDKDGTDNGSNFEKIAIISDHGSELDAQALQDNGHIIA